MCAIAALYGGDILAGVALRPPRRALAGPPPDGAEAIVIAAADGAALRGWFFRASGSGGNAVIVLHGVADNRRGVLGLVRMLARRQYDVLAPDARAHGESGGSAATYGLLEADDIHRWVSWLAETKGARHQYGLGESMGGSLLLQALPGEPRIEAAVAECPFSSFREIAYDRVGQSFGGGDWMGRFLLRPYVEAALLSAWRQGVDLASASPERALTRTRTPVLLIHPVDDRNIPVRHSRRLKRVHPEVTLWEVPRGGHTGALAAFPEEYEHRVVGWFGGSK